MTDNSYAELASLLERFSYKPGWEFALAYLPHFGEPLVANLEIRYRAHLEIRYRAPDTTDPSNTIELFSRVGVPFNISMFHPEGLIKWLRGAIQQAEMHELEEFFRIDGAQVRNPHPLLT